MRGTFRLARVFGINIDIHFTFFLLLAFFFLLLGPRGLALIVGIFFFVTVHELCHSLVALHFGIKVKRITLLPIGGVASMTESPKKPYQELLISIAGPLSNVMVVLIFYYPLMLLLGKDTLMHPFYMMIGKVPFTGQISIIAHIYWLNLVLAVFNMLPAFPMDGGRVLRAILSYRMSYKEATDVAVRLGHIFALLFGYLGIVHGHIFLIIIAVFIYMAASSEGFQVDVQETIKKYTVFDILSKDFIYVEPDAPLSKLLELVLHTHNEDFPVMEDGKMIGFVTRRNMIQGIHVKGKDTPVREIMRTDVPAVKITTGLNKVQKMMGQHQTSALPVERNGKIIGIVTIDDINRVYVMVSEK